jgi:hypothetical protein
MSFPVNFLHDINVYIIALVYVDYLNFLQMAEAQRPVAGQVVPVSTEASLVARASLSKKRKQGGGASRKTSTR